LTFLLGGISGYQFKVLDTLIKTEPVIIERIEIKRDTVTLYNTKEVYKPYRKRTITHRLPDRVLTITYKGEIIDIDEQFQYIDFNNWKRSGDSIFFNGEGILDTLPSFFEH
jgi:hypothetical protein